MADLPTKQEVAAVMEKSLRADLDPDGLGLVNLNPGSDLKALVSMETQGVARVTEYVADRLAARDPANSIDSDLDDLAQQRYKTKRKEEAFAVGTVYLVRTTTGATSIPVGHRFGVEASDTKPGVQYGADATIVVGSGVLKVAVAITCLVAGEVGNVNLGDITSSPDQYPDGADWQLFVPTFGDPVLAGAAEPDKVGGGAERESNADLQARLAKLTPDAEPGTPEGVLKGALEVPGVLYVDVVEPSDGTTIVYAGDAGYQLPAALKKALETELRKWRALGNPILVRAYNAQTVTLVIDAYMARELSNYDQAALTSSGRTNILYYFKTQRPRADEYYMGAIGSAVYKVDDDVQSVVFSDGGIGGATVDVKRPPDASYGAITALNRYIASEASILIRFHDPQTT